MNTKSLFRFILTLVVAFGFTSCVVLMMRFAGMKNPRVETHGSINAYLDKQTGDMFGQRYALDCMSDSASVMDNFLYGMEYPVYVFNAEGRLYSYIGTCVAGISCYGKQISAAFDSLDTYYRLCDGDTLTLSELLDRSTYIGREPQQLKPVPTIVMTWNKYLRMIDFDVLEDLRRRHPADSLNVILVNTDLQESWGLQPGKRFRLGFRIVQDNGEGVTEMQMIFKDKLPFRKQ